MNRRKSLDYRSQEIKNVMTGKALSPATRTRLRLAGSVPHPPMGSQTLGAGSRWLGSQVPPPPPHHLQPGGAEVRGGWHMVLTCPSGLPPSIAYPKAAPRHHPHPLVSPPSSPCLPGPPAPPPPPRSPYSWVSSPPPPRSLCSRVGGPPPPRSLFLRVGSLPPPKSSYS